MRKYKYIEYIIHFMPYQQKLESLHYYFMKGFSARSSECLHRIVRLAAHQKCSEKAMICSQSCQFKQSHLVKGDHPTITVQQFISKIKAKRSQIQKQGQKHVSIIEEQFKQAVQNLKKKKQECQQNIRELIKTSGYSQKHFVGLQKVQNQRFQSLLCKQVYDLLRFQPIMTKKTMDSFQKNVRDFENCKFKHLVNDKNFFIDYQNKTGDLTNKKNIKQQKNMDKIKEKNQMIRQRPKANLPQYLLLQDKIYVQQLIAKNEQLQILLKKTQNTLTKLNGFTSQQKINRPQQTNSNQDSESVVQIKQNQTIQSHNTAIKRAIQKYLDKKGQQNNYIYQKKKQVSSQNLSKQKESLVTPKNNTPSVVPKSISPLLAVQQNKQTQKEGQKQQASQLSRNGKQKQKQSSFSQEGKKMQIQYQNRPTFNGTGTTQKTNSILQKSNQRQQKNQIKQSMHSYSQPASNKNKAQINNKINDQNFMVNEKNTSTNAKEVIKEEYNQGQEIYNYYDRQSKNKQARYTNTQVLKNSGGSLENVIKLQYTYPIPSFTQKFVLKQIPKLTIGKPKITTLNYASKINNNKQAQFGANNFSPSKVANSDKDKDKGSINSNNTPNKFTPIKSQATSFLNAPTGGFKAPPTMTLNDPTIRNDKADISKVFERQEQRKKLMQEKKQHDEKIRRQFQEKQKQQREEKIKKKQIQQKKLLQAQRQKQKIDQQIIQNLMKSTEPNDAIQTETTPNGCIQQQQLQIPKLSDQDEIPNMKPQIYTPGQQMKMEQQKEQNSMEIQQNSDSFQI